MATRQREKKAKREALKTSGVPRFKASHMGLPMSARKVRLVADLVRREPVGDALRILEFSDKRAAVYIRKVVNSARDNAVKSGAVVDEKRLVVDKIEVDEGTYLKRWRPGGMGRANPYKKYRCHIKVEVVEKKD